VVGWVAAGRARAQTSDLPAALRLVLRYALLTCAWTLLLMLVIWGPFAFRYAQPGADLTQTGVPMFLFEPGASFVGWVVLMVLISPFLQLLTTVFAACVRLAYQQ